MFDFKQKIVMITGAAGFLGSTTTHAFHNAGATIAVVDRLRNDMEQAFGETMPENEHCLYVAADLLDEGSVANMVNQVIERFGRIDVLVNIAGGYSAGSPVHKTPLRTWDFMLNLNARSVFLVCRSVIPHMLNQSEGKIISVAARAGLQGKANMAAYVVSKSAVIRLTESMSAEVKDKNINVNCILPGTIDTERNREDTPDADFSKWVKPEDIANVILFLASDTSRAINGAAIPVYGQS